MPTEGWIVVSYHNLLHDLETRTFLGRVRANCVDVVHGYMAVARFPKVSSVALPILLSSSSKRWKPVTELQVKNAVQQLPLPSSALEWHAYEPPS